MFFELRAAMTASNDNEEQTQMIDPLKLQKLTLETKFKLKHIDTIIEYEDETAQKNREHRAEIAEKDRQHKTDLQQARLEAENETMRRILAAPHALPIPTPTASPKSAPAASASSSEHTLKNVIDDFLSEYQTKNKPAMLKKHQPVLSALLELVGDKAIAKLDQDDINNFFIVINKLPPRWLDACRIQKLSIRQLSELDHKIVINPKTFKSTYFASIRYFLKKAKNKWQTKGFPLALSIEGIEYTGDREADERAQRALEVPELKRLFEGEEMRSFANDPTKAHFFWLPHVGLYTGARVNEICQINPQTDILKDEKTGINYFLISEDTETDLRVDKSVKTKISRRVPIHKHLIDIGFIQYFERVKSSGAKLLFPDWSPVGRRASGQAEKWFRMFLRDTGLRDETPKAMLLGMHAFRHTLLTHGGEQTPSLYLMCITGHEQDEVKSKVRGEAKGYFRRNSAIPLNKLDELLNQLDYKLKLFKPRTS